MAEINAGEVTVGAGTYEVILRRVGGSNSNTGGTGASAGEEQSFTVGGKRKGSRKTRKAGKTMEGGKRKKSSYFKFVNARRPQIIKENPALKSDVVAVAKKLGAEWRSMSDAEKAKY